MSNDTYTPRSLRENFEQAIFDDPDDVANFAAFADYLQEQDDEADNARGEFIQVQLALEDSSISNAERQKLQTRERQLLSAHEKNWLGDLTPFFFSQTSSGGSLLDELDDNQYGSFRFRRGFLGRVELDFLTIGFARAIAKSPLCRLMRELLIDKVAMNEGDVLPEDNVPEGEMASGLTPLLNCPHLTHVRRLRIGMSQGDNHEHFTCGVRNPQLPQLVGQLPRLEEISLFAADYSLNEIFKLTNLTNLRVLQIYHLNHVHELENLVANESLQNLQELLIHPPGLSWNNYEYEGEEAEAPPPPPDNGYLPLAAVRPIFQADNLPNLTHLRLRLSSMGDEGCTELVSSGILQRLKRLDLRHGAITDTGAETLANSPDIKNLEWIDLNFNALSADGIAMIKRLGIRCQVDLQHLPGEETEGLGPRYLLQGADLSGMY